MIKPGAENPEQKWRIAESTKHMRSSSSISICWKLFLETLGFKQLHIEQSVLFMCRDPLHCSATSQNTHCAML